MLFDLATLTSEQLSVAQTPEIGAESGVQVSHRDFVQLFELQNASADGHTSTEAFTVPLVLSEIAHLHMRMDNGGRYSADGPKLILDITDEDDFATTVEAHLVRPSWVASALNVIPIGATVDFTQVGGAPLVKKVKTITGINAFTGGENGFLNRLSIWQSFDSTEFVDVGCARSKEGAFKLPSTIEIACGYDPAAYTKKGRSESQNLSLSFPWVSQWDGLAQLNGHRSTVLLSTIKDDSVPWENTLYTGYRPNASPSRGDGDDEVLATSEGSYENFFIFGAK